MRALITGGAGFIGSHLCEVAVREGRGVRAMYLYSSFGSRGWLDALPDSIVSEMEIVGRTDSPIPCDTATLTPNGAPVWATPRANTSVPTT